MDNQMQNDQDSTNESEWIVVMSPNQRRIHNRTVIFYQKNQNSINIIKRFIGYVKRRMVNLLKLYWKWDHTCIFCGMLDTDCPESGDHSDEMREICRRYDS